MLNNSVSTIVHIAMTSSCNSSSGLLQRLAKKSFGVLTVAALQTAKDPVDQSSYPRCN